MVPGIHAAFIAVAEPPHGTVTRELLPLAVILNVPVPAAPISHVRVIVTPPEVAAAAAACAGLIAIAAAMTESSPTHDACIALLARSRRPFSTHLVIGFGLRILRNKAAGKRRLASISGCSSRESWGPPSRLRPLCPRHADLLCCLAERLERLEARAAQGRQIEELIERDEPRTLRHRP